MLISRGGSFYARTILGVHVRDLTGGFKCFRRAVLETIDLGAVTAKGYGFQIEVTYRALRAGSGGSRSRARSSSAASASRRWTARSWSRRCSRCRC
jgi:hypothetical protein